MQIKNILQIILLFLSIPLFTKCNRDYVYNEFKHIKNECWNRTDEYYFAFDITDNTQTYDISVQLRNSDFYPYQNIWIISNLQNPNKTFSRDTIECMLADDFGKWTGNGINLFQNSFCIKQNINFKDTGMYVLSFKHGMRDKTIKGIEDIGVLIRESHN